MTIRIKNNTGSVGVWAGQTIDPDEYYTLLEADLIDWRTDSFVFQSVADGDLIVNNGTDETFDIADPIEGWAWLNGTAIQEVEIKEVAKVDGKKLSVHTSSRPEIANKQFFTVWTGAGDDIVNHVIGAGNEFKIQTSVGEAEKTLEIEFDTTLGDVYIHEGYIMWEGASFGDCVSSSVFSRATQLQELINLDLELDGNRVKFAAGGPGTGTHGFAATPVILPNREDTGHWDLDASFNLLPNLSQTGEYDIYNIEIEVIRIFHKIPIFGTSTQLNVFKSADSSLLTPGYYIKVVAHNNSDTEWCFSVVMALFRERTV